MRILWMSNSPNAATGYGVQSAEVLPRIKADGHEVAVAANFGFSATQGLAEWDDIPVFPSSKDQALNDIINAYAEEWRADWTISLYDVWTMQRNQWPKQVASWVPIDHNPAPPAVAQWCRSVRPIAMSRFGQEMLRQQNIESVYIPHSVNTEVFRPTSEYRGKPSREMLGLPDDAYVVVIAGANQGISPPRKAWSQMFQALGHFLKAHNDAWVYVHTDLHQRPPAGLDLSTLLAACGMDDKRVRFTDSYMYTTGRISQADMAAIYSTGDVLLSTSMGEGFGVPVIEAQACGLPVIVSDFSAQPELCESGWLVKGQGWWDPLSGQGLAWFYDPYVPSIVKHLELAYEARGDQGLRDRAVAFAAAYDTATVYERYWRPFLTELAATEPAKLNRAARRRAKKAAA